MSGPASVHISVLQNFCDAHHVPNNPSAAEENKAKRNRIDPEILKQKYNELQKALAIASSRKASQAQEQEPKHELPEPLKADLPQLR